MKISVLIPAKNEPLINDLIEKIHEVLRNFEHEIIVIDKSDVPSKINNVKLIIQKSTGLGQAVLEGFEESTGDMIIVMDADFSHNPKYLPKFIKNLKKSDIVIGTRYISGGKNEDYWIRQIISRGAIFLIKTFLGIKTKDPVSGFIGIKRKTINSIQLNPIGFKILVEILYKIKNKGFKITELPIKFVPRKDGKSKFTFREVVHFFMLILSLKYVKK